MHCVWWLVPGSDWPAYSRARLIIIAEGHTACIGLNVEKGLAPVAAESPGLVNSPMGMVRGAGRTPGGSQLVARLAEEAGVLPKLRLTVSVVSGDPYSTSPSDRIQWEFHGGTMEPDPETTPGVDLGLAVDLPEVAAAEELVAEIIGLFRFGQGGWFWFGLAVFCRLALAAKRQDDALGAGEVADVLAKPWMRWLR